MDNPPIDDAEVTDDVIDDDDIDKLDHYLNNLGSELNLSILTSSRDKPAPKTTRAKRAKSRPAPPENRQLFNLLFLGLVSILLMMLVALATWQFAKNQMTAQLDIIAAALNARPAPAVENEIKTVEVPVTVVVEGEPKTVEVPVTVVIVVTATPLPVTPTPPATVENAAGFSPPPPTATATPITIAAAAIQPVAVFAQPAPIIAKGSTIYFADDFSGNSKGWFTGPQAHPHARDVTEIVDGRYRRNLFSTQEMLSRQPAPPVIARNFVLSIDATMLETTGNTGIGLIFREDGQGNYYAARFLADGSYNLSLFQGETQTTLLPTTTSTAFALTPGTTHTFSLVANGPQLSLYANNQWLATITDNTLPNAGTIGLAAYVAQPNNGLTVDFDNLLVTDTP